MKIKTGILNELFKSDLEAIFDLMPRNGLMAAKKWQTEDFLLQKGQKGPYKAKCGEFGLKTKVFSKNHVFFIFYAFNAKSPLGHSLKWSKLLPNYI